MPRVRLTLLVIGFFVVAACGAGVISPWFLLLGALIALMRAILVVSEMMLLRFGTDDWGAMPEDMKTQGFGMVTAALMANLIGYVVLFAVVYGVRALVT